MKEFLEKAVMVLIVFTISFLVIYAFVGLINFAFAEHYEVHSVNLNGYDRPTVFYSKETRWSVGYIYEQSFSTMADAQDFAEELVNE